MERSTGHAVGLRRVARVAAPVREQLREIVLDAILAGEYAPGARLIERELCERTGASRTSVREVLRQLDAEGLVETVPNRGTIVSVVKPEDVVDIYEIREVLEGLSARCFAERATEANVRRLRRTLDEIADAVEHNDHLAMLEAKTHFYDALLDGAGNRVTRQTLLTLRTRISMLRSTTLRVPGRLKSTLAEVQEIIDAIEARDAARAEEASRRHVRNAAELALASVAAAEEASGPADTAMVQPLRPLGPAAA